MLKRTIFQHSHSYSLSTQQLKHNSTPICYQPMNTQYPATLFNHKCPGSQCPKCSSNKDKSTVPPTGTKYQPTSARLPLPPGNPGKTTHHITTNVGRKYSSSCTAIVHGTQRPKHQHVWITQDITRGSSSVLPQPHHVNGSLKTSYTAKPRPPNQRPHHAWITENITHGTPRHTHGLIMYAITEDIIHGRSSAKHQPHHVWITEDIIHGIPRRTTSSGLIMHAIRQHTWQLA
jgi:hypothetical protein